MRSGLAPKLNDFRTFEVTTNVAVGEERRLLYELVVRRGRNEKQKRLELITAQLQEPTY